MFRLQLAWFWYRSDHGIIFSTTPLRGVVAAPIQSQQDKVFLHNCFTYLLAQGSPAQLIEGSILRFAASSREYVLRQGAAGNSEAHHHSAASSAAEPPVGPCLL